ncbi:MAG: NADH-quinone oxidoreductase subunit NuoG [Chloroflexi bacterium]|nr:NADH-quinone oxidoreductase subunit NuoG [Chloroflexota bacterium]
MAKLVTLTIDGQQVSVPEGALVVDAAKKIGVDIPVFCYHPKMAPVGMCRVCLVEVGRPVIDRATGQPALDENGAPRIQFSPKLETGCTTPVAEGMVVLGASEKAKAGRKDILELLLTSHPLDCPICDKGGECPLQNLTMDWGAGESRFIYDEKQHLPKRVHLGELILLDRERCIQCARCIRFQEDIAADPVISFYHRGRMTEIVTHSDPGFDSIFSGNTTDICPVGALTTADFRFGARPWEMNAAASICPQCPVGCNVTYNVRREAKAGGGWVIKRAMPRQNEAVNEIWMCDKGRFTYHYAESGERLKQPLVRKNGELTPASWDEALDLVASRFKQAGADLFTLAGGRLSNEDLFNLRQLTAGLGGQTALYGYMAGGDLTAQVGLGQGSDLSSLGPETAILVVASDLHEEAPVWWLRLKAAAQRGAKLIVANPRPTRLDDFAARRLRYGYGAEAAAVLAMLNALSPKRPNLPENVQALLRSHELQAAAKEFAAAENAIVFFGSEGLGLDGSQALAQACANLLIATGHAGKVNNGLVGVWQRANDQGAWDMGFRPRPDLRAAMQAARALYIVAADPAGDDPALAETGDFLVVQELTLTATAKLADVVLPVLAYTEREGSYTSGERRVQRYYPVTPDRFGGRADFTVSAQIAQRLGLPAEGRAASLVMARIAAAVADYAGLSYQKLAEVSEQWPAVGRGDVYYGGTGYENKQGLGCQLAPAAQRGAFPAQTWPQIPPQAAAGGFLAAPVTRLYDRGATVLPSRLLHARIPQPYIVMNSADAENLALSAGALVQATLNGVVSVVKLALDEGVPQGVILVPRSMGMTLDGPAPAGVAAAELAAA